MNALTRTLKGERVRRGTPLFDEIEDFLVDEAALLDADELYGWLDLLCEDLHYTAPLRVTKMRSDPEGDIVRRNQHYYDDYSSIRNRIRRLKDTKSAWAEDPPSRVRRFISNVSIWRTDKESEFYVVSYLMLTRNRFERPDHQMVTAERRDVLRRVGEGLKVASREIIVDTSVLGTPNLAIFL